MTNPSKEPRSDGEIAREVIFGGQEKLDCLMGLVEWRALEIRITAALAEKSATIKALEAEVERLKRAGDGIFFPDELKALRTENASLKKRLDVAVEALEAIASGAQISGPADWEIECQRRQATASDALAKLREA